MQRQYIYSVTAIGHVAGYLVIQIQNDFHSIEMQ